MTEYIAHTKESGEAQHLKEHLCSTADKAQDNAIEMFKSIAFEIGKAHDIGKYSEAFQRRIRGENIHVEHAVSGAIEINRDTSINAFFKPLMEYCIAGHHSGLPDGGVEADLDDKSTLHGRLKRIPNDYSAFRNDIQINNPNTIDLQKCFAHFTGNTLKDACELYAFFTKYLFSCLTDADFIDTEKYCNPHYERGIVGDFSVALNLVEKKIKSFKKDTKVRKARNELLLQASKNSENQNEILLLNMPTGSGKTLCSLKIALEKAIKENKKRIIYVIPYTSIIEQTADQFSEILGDTLYVLKHHSNYTFEQEENEDASTAEKLKRTCENWDAPLIVTTSVQFFQSLYHYKGRGLRKMHNMADAIIIFDEIHLIPIEYIQPCLRGIGYVTKYLNSSAFFLSATMPNYTDLFNKYMPENDVAELIKDKTMFHEFNNCEYNYLGVTTYERVVELAIQRDNSLIIVNKRKTARELYQMIPGKKFHLSTYMTPNDRSTVIKEIKNALACNEKITVVSTSLVEAGVDFDFHTVFRQMTGLDSILQSGGRCNREGIREKGQVFVFDVDEKQAPDVAIRANIARELFDSKKEFSSEKNIHDYYNRLFSFNEKAIEANSIGGFGGTPISFLSIPFQSYAESFEYIKSDTIAIVINNNDKCNALLEELKWGGKKIRRKLQKYCVSIYTYEFKQIYDLGVIREEEGIFILENMDYYNHTYGLDWNATLDENYII